MAMLRTTNLTKIYVNNNNNNTIRAIINCNLEIEEGEFVTISGAVGSGKSTLLHLLGGYDRPSSGSVYMNHKDIFNLSNRELSSMYRQVVGYILYDYQLIPGLTVYENILMPIILNHCTLDKSYMEYITESLHIKNILDCYPKNISDEQKQCVAIVRALINKPKIILADEPTKNLDYPMSCEVLEILMNYLQQNRSTLIMVTNKPETSIFADHIIRLDRGMIVEDSKI